MFQQLTLQKSFEIFNLLFNDICCPFPLINSKGFELTKEDMFPDTVNRTSF